MKDLSDFDILAELERTCKAEKNWFSPPNPKSNAASAEGPMNNREKIAALDEGEEWSTSWFDEDIEDNTK